MKLNIKILIFWLFVLFIQQSKSQSYIKAYDSITSIKTFKESKVEIDSLLSDAMNQKAFREAAEIAHHIFIHYYKNEKNYLKAINYGLIEVQNHERLGEVNKKYIQILYNLGWAYYKAENYYDSIKYHQKVIKHNKEKVAESYCEVGRNFSKLGDFYKSEEFYTKGINLLEEQQNNKSIVGKYFGLINAYISLNTKNSLNKQYTVLKKVEKLNLTERQKRSLDNYYASYYSNPKTFNFKKAKPHYLKNLAQSIKVNDSAFICASFINLGDLYNEAKNDSAHYFLKQSSTFCKKKESISIAEHQKSKWYFIKKDYDKALLFINASIERLINIDSPSSKSFESVTDKFNLLLAIQQKAKTLLSLYKKDGNILHVENALKQLQLIDDFIDTIENNTTEEKSQLHWRLIASKAYSNAIKCSKILNRPDLAFYFNEKSKALLLTESILKNDLSSTLPKAISKKELSFKKQILKLENELNETMKDSLFNLKVTYQKFSDSLKNSFPEYYYNKAKTQLFSLRDVKKKLSKNTLVVSYNWNQLDNNSEFNGFAFTKNKNFFFSIKKTDEIDQNIKKYRSLISQPIKTKQDKDAYETIAHQLFNTLFPEELSALIENKKLIIIPDGDLQNLPFEALITNKDSNTYLIESNDISYAYSMSFLLHNKSIERNTSKDFIGFAPITFSNKELNTLKQTEQELTNIQNIISGNSYTADTATKNNFLNDTDSKIIHLATHANASGDPWIAFQDEKLRLHELYTYKNQADLAILSACETAQGEIAIGEGVMSLARGFFYSGANSVVSSLWSVNDKSTSTIMTNFYTNLKEGETKSEALRNAKLNYIKTHSLSEASPYYWSSFILIGDSGTLTLEQNNTFLYVAIFSLILLLIGFLVYSKLKK